MHGLILTSFIAFVRDAHGDVAGLVPDDASYLPTEAYDDEELNRMLVHVAAGHGKTREDVERDFGRYAGRQAFHRLYPDFYDAAGGTRPFLLEVERKIHDLVRATVPNAEPPRLHVTELGDQGVVVSYTSYRHLCHLAEGLVQGVADHFEETVEINHVQCMHRGDLACALFVAPAPEAA